jgi:WD40 repeat protein
VLAVAFSPDDKLLASGSADQTIKLWDVVTGKERRTLTGHTDRVSGIAFSPTGKRLASSSGDGTVRLWDMATGDELLKLVGHQGPVTSVTFNTDDRHIASGSEDKTVRVWDMTTGQAVTIKKFPATVSGVAFSPDGKQIASVIDHGATNPANYSLLWDPFSGKESTHAETQSRTCVAFRPDGKAIASAVAPGRSKQREGGKRPEIAEMALAPNSPFITLGHHDSTISQLVFDQDGKRLASVSFDRRLKVWDVETRKEISSFSDDAGMCSVTFSPDGGRLATGSSNGTIAIWATPGASVRTYSSHDSRHVCFRAYPNYSEGLQ